MREDFIPNVLPVGTTRGCLTIIGDFEEYEKYMEEETQRRVEKLKKQKSEYLETGKIAPIVREDGSILCSGFTMRANPVRALDNAITESLSWKQNPHYRPRYKAMCKCGNVFYIDHDSFIRKRHTYCDLSGASFNAEKCGLRAERRRKRLNAAERIKERDYNAALPYSVHETLDILGFGEDIEVLRSKQRGQPYFLVKRTFLCKCHLCGKQHSFTREDFNIQSDDYGVRAIDGYYSDAYCDCHQISSFQWRTIDILRKHKVPYKAEISFDDLRGAFEQNNLRFDFGIFSEDDILLALIECQGAQHYKPIKKFGGQQAFERQITNDDKKREYASLHNIPLIEIPYTCNTYAKEEKFLQNKGVLDAKHTIKCKEKGK